MKNTTETRHGKRAEGIVNMAIPMPIEMKKAIEALAKKDSRTTAAWVRMSLQKLVKRSRAARKLKVAA